LEALVFEQECEALEDTTLPDIQFQDSKIQPYVEELTNTFGRVCQCLLMIIIVGMIYSLFLIKDPAGATKRPSSSKAGESSAKVPRLSNRDEIVSAILTNSVRLLTFS